MGQLSDLIKDKKLIVCLGAGGVGKTTTTVGIAVNSALHGRRTALLSIDPAKRLAKAIGLNLGGNLEEVKLPGLGNGHLYAAMLDQKSVFDEMVTRFTKGERARERVLNNKVYQAVSRHLGGTIEYMALAKLDNLLNDPRFDLVVLDTPPDTHAIDFLAKPDLLAGFTESKVINWVIKPFYLAQRMGVSKLITWGDKLAGGLAKVAGVETLQTLSEFLVVMQDTINGFHTLGQSVKRALVSDQSCLCVVSTPLPAALRSAENIAEQLQAINQPADALILNRMIPPQVTAALLGSPQPAASQPTYRQAWQAISAALSIQESILQKAATSTAKYRKILQVSEQDYDIHSPEGVMLLARSLDS